MHHDGMHYFPLPVGTTNSFNGLIAVNHEYTDDGLLHVGGMVPWTAEKVAKSQAAHGVSVVEVQQAAGRVEHQAPVVLRAPHHGHDADATSRGRPPDRTG